MKFITNGMHATEYGQRLYFARFNEAALGDDGTGTLELRIQTGNREDLFGDFLAEPLHVCTPAISPDGRNAVVTVEIPNSASVHAKRHGGTGYYTDLWYITSAGRVWTQLTQYANAVSTPWFPTTPAGALIPQWIDNDELIWTQAIGYRPELVLGVREIVTATLVNEAGPPHLDNYRTYRPGWAQGARFYEVWGIKDGVALVCTDYGRSSHAYPGLCLWEIGSDELVPLSAGNPTDWEEQAFFVDGRIFFMSTAGLGYQPAGAGGANFWRTFQTELHVMDEDGSHRERVTFVNQPGHPDYVDRVEGDTVRAFPFSKTRHGLYLDIVRNRGAVQLHGEAQIWHICL